MGRNFRHIIEGVLQLMTVLEKNLAKAKKDPHSFIAKVQIANIFLKGPMWYIVVLWAGSEGDLQEMERVIISFN